VAVEESVNPLIFRAAEMIREARKQLRDPSPANLYRCTDLFAVANSCMESLRAADTTADAAVNRAALQSLRQDVAAVAALLESAASFHGNLMRSMQSRCAPGAVMPPAATYTPLRVEA